MIHLAAVSVLDGADSQSTPCNGVNIWPKGRPEMLFLEAAVRSASSESDHIGRFGAWTFTVAPTGDGFRLHWQLRYQFLLLEHMHQPACRDVQDCAKQSFCSLLPDGSGTVCKLSGQPQLELAEGRITPAANLTSLDLSEGVPAAALQTPALSPMLGDPLKCTYKLSQRSSTLSLARFLR